MMQVSETGMHLCTSQLCNLNYMFVIVHLKRQLFSSILKKNSQSYHNRESIRANVSFCKVKRAVKL